MMLVKFCNKQLKHSMKKIFLLALITTSIAISSCKKDKKADKEEPQVTNYEEIIEKRSVWHINDEIHKYMNSGGQQVVNDSVHYTVPNGTQYIFKNDKLSITTGTGTSAVTAIYNYTFSISNGKNIISISPESNPGQVETYDVLSATSRVMVWEQQKSNITYRDKIGVSGTYRIRFHCPCPE
jgi:hypothetical protein